MLMDKKKYEASLNASQMFLQLYDMGLIEKDEIMTMLDRVMPQLYLRDRIQILCQVGDRQILSVEDIRRFYYVDYEFEKELIIDDKIKSKRNYEALLHQVSLIFSLSDKSLLQEKEVKELLENLLPYLDKEDKMSVMGDCASRGLFTIVNDKWRYDE